MEIPDRVAACDGSALVDVSLLSYTSSQMATRLPRIRQDMAPAGGGLPSLPGAALFFCLFSRWWQAFLRSSIGATCPSVA
jgi:hypothetical protein